jgi:hypothetical protein
VNCSPLDGGAAVARDMMLTPDEYMAMMRLITSERESEGSTESLRETNSTVSKPRKTTRTMRASRKKLSKALKQANARYRNKNGSLKKGKSQADVMKLAQRLRKRM